MSTIRTLVATSALLVLPALLQPSQAHPAHAAPAAAPAAHPAQAVVANPPMTVAAPARVVERIVEVVERIVEGPRQALGRGEAFTWAGLDAAGQPVSLGINLTPSALDGLPGEITALHLPLPAEARAIGYDHVGLDWAPRGHEPPGVYDRPHFDFHFYRVSVTALERMTPEDPAFEARLAHEPAAEFVPPGFARVPGGVPRMGAHWIATDAPELNGQPFDKTVLVGSYDGELTFVEPMVTRAFLQTRAEVLLPIRAPQMAVGRLAWPAAYRISFEDGMHRIALVGLRLLPQR